MTGIQRNIAFVVMFSGALACAQDAKPKAVEPPPMSRTERADRMQTAPTTMFYLKNVSQPNDGNEILTGLRLMLDPSVKIYLVPSQNAIVIRALPDDVALATKLIGEMDRPKHSYRLNLTLTEMDGGKKAGAQHFTLVAEAGQRVTMKSGSKIPVSTGKFVESSEVSELQMTYLDVGWNFDMTLNETESGGVLKYRLERSSVGEEKPVAGLGSNPLIRQATLDGTTTVARGKSQMLGSMEIPESARHLEVEVVMEPVM